MAPGSAAAPMVDDTQIADLRAQVRDLLRSVPITVQCDSWMRGVDPDFTRAVAERGWIGMTWPVEAGGGGRSNLERLVVTEELLRAGAPVAAHWTADRQIGPSLVRLGTPELRTEFLGPIRRGELIVCLGLSETEAGSDLAAVRTRAERVEGGWRIRGAKIWTTSAHRATHAYVLARSADGERKQEGLTEFLVDMDSPGLSVRPIRDLVGEHHFNEMVFDDVFVPDSRVLGMVGNGWAQVTEQLAFERGGVERYLSMHLVLVAMVEASRLRPDRAVDERLGELTARLAVLRRLSGDLAAGLDAGAAPTREAAELKLLGTLFEKDVIQQGRYVLDVCGAGAEALDLLADGTAAVPAGSIRGGASEIMRTVIARAEMDATGLPVVWNRDLRDVVDAVLRPEPGTEADPAAQWRMVVDLGWHRVGVDEGAGGAGGDLGDVLELAVGAGRHAVRVPLWQTALAGWTLASSGLEEAALDSGAAVLVGTGLTARETAGRLSLAGHIARAPWVMADRMTVLAVSSGERHWIVRLDPGTATVTDEGTDLADQPLGGIDLDGVTVERDAHAPVTPELLAELVYRRDLLRSAAMLGAVEQACVSTVEHVSTRQQFGKPLVAQQAVAHTVADMVLQRRQVAAAVQIAFDAPAERGVADIAVVIAAAAATEVATGAHQLHGAMGITREHGLHLSTRRLWAWHDADGGARAAAARLGAQVREGDGDDVLWALIVGEKR